MESELCDSWYGVDLSVRYAALRTVHLININEFNDRNALPTKGGGASDQRATSMSGP
jgi:hypothetical protein